MRSDSQPSSGPGRTQRGTATNFTREIRRAIADYIWSEGCSCCQATDRHNDAAMRIAKLLHVPTYQDGSGYDFGKFRTKKPRRQR